MCIVKSQSAMLALWCLYIYIYIYIYTQGVTGGTDQTSGERSLGQTIPI